jgi:Protein of unknown function (DUF3262)
VRRPALASLRAVALGLLWPLLVLAAVVTAGEVATAVRNSPTASPWLKAHADEIGALAIKVESGGNTTAYNGSCCYGVLQLNTTNIIAAGFSVTAYRYASLQDQVNGWAEIQAKALADPVIKRLSEMGTFDGQPVDASLLLACAQMGQGNCRKMVRSGRCKGFEDVLGTDICEMAAKTRAALGKPSPPPGGMPGGGSGSGSGSGLGSGPGVPSGPALDMAPDAAFKRGAGVSMDAVSEAVRSTSAAALLLWVAWLVAGNLSLFTHGQLTMHVATRSVLKAVVLVMVLMSFLS